MLDWRAKIIQDLVESTEKNDLSKDYFNCLTDDSSGSIHLGIFVEPFLQYIMDGKKTIETRFSAVRCAPFERVSEGDIVLLKKSGGPVTAVCRIRTAWFYRLETDSWSEIKKFARQICAEDPKFWEQRRHASFATLMRIQDVQPISPLNVAKRDRRGWVVLHENLKP